MCQWVELDVIRTNSRVPRHCLLSCFPVGFLQTLTGTLYISVLSPLLSTVYWTRSGDKAVAGLVVRVTGLQVACGRPWDQREGGGGGHVTGCCFGVPTPLSLWALLCVRVVTL